MRPMRLPCVLLLSTAALVAVACGSDPASSNPVSSADAGGDAAIGVLDSGSAVPAATGRVLHEHQFAQDSQLRAKPGDTLVIELEHPNTLAHKLSPFDSGAAGQDEVPFEAPTWTPMRLCPPEGGMGHVVELLRQSGEMIASTSGSTGCQMALVPPGTHNVRFQHDGSGTPEDGPVTVFWRPLPIGSTEWCERLAGDAELAKLCTKKVMDFPAGPGLGTQGARYLPASSTLPNLDFGEAAVYLDCPYAGPAWILTEATKDEQSNFATFATAIGSPVNLNRQVSSVVLGPETWLWGYDQPNFAHIGQAFQCNESCLFGATKYTNANGVVAFNDVMQSASVMTTRTIALQSSQCKGCNMAGVNFRGAQLSNVDLTGANLNSSQFNASTLNGVIFDGADLTAADFSYANLTGCSFSASPVLTETTFHGTALTCVKFEDADVTPATFDRPLRVLAGSSCRTSFARSTVEYTQLTATAAPIHGVWKNLDLSNTNVLNLPAPPDWSHEDLSGVCLRHMNLHGGTFHGTNFTAAILDTIDLTDAVADSALFVGTSMIGAQMSRISASNADWTGGSNLSSAQLDSSTVSGAKFDGATLKAANFSYATAVGATFSAAILNADATLASANLSYADLQNAKFDAAKLGGVQMVHASLHGPQATVSGADLTLTNLSNANLSSLNFSSVVGKGANLSGAVLCFANLKGADFSVHSSSGATVAASLSGALLCGAALDATNLSGSNLTGAAVLVAGGQVMLPDGTLKTCPSATIGTNVVTLGATCPDGSAPAGQCSAASWQSPPPAPAPCCVSDGTTVCPNRKHQKASCTTACDCQSGVCTSGLCQ